MLSTKSGFRTDTNLAGSLSKGTSTNSIEDFNLIKLFKVDCHASKGNLIKQVDWFAPLVGWIKCNSDGSARGAPGYAAAGGIFRDSTCSVKGCYASFLGNLPALHAEFIAAIMTIEIAFHKGWNSLWLECDSKVVVDAFSSNSVVPWQLLNRWKNCPLLKG